jgi:hypothetical protein
MTISDVLHSIGAISLLSYGLASAINPHWVAGLLEHGLRSGRGISEFRVAHGGGIVALALFALYINNPLVYRALGWAWIGAATIRILAYLPDRPRVTADYVIFLIAEIALGICLLL